MFIQGKSFDSYMQVRRKMLRYKNLKELYNIESINNEYILMKKNNKYYKKYIYEITPVVILDFSVETQNTIMALYDEFLRELDISIQIYMTNRKMNLEEYIHSLESIHKDKQEKRFKELLEEYLSDLKEKIRMEKIYITKYYIIVSLELKKVDDIKIIDNIIYKLNKLGCVVNRLNDKQQLEKILYESINKEELYG